MMDLFKLFEDTLHHGGEGMVIGAPGGLVLSKEAEMNAGTLLSSCYSVQDLSLVLPHLG